MAEVYGNVNVNYSYCKSVAQLKSAADYILETKKEQIKGEIKTYVRLAMNSTETRTLEDVVEMLKKIYLIPDFSVCTNVTVSIENMNEIRRENFRKCDIKCAEIWSREKYEGKSRWTPSDVKQWQKLLKILLRRKALI